MTRQDVVNSFAYKAAKEAVDRFQSNQELDIDSFEDGATWGRDYIIGKACEWLVNNFKEIGIQWQRGGGAGYLVEQFKIYIKQ